MQPKTAKRRSAFRRANRTMPRRRIDIAMRQSITKSRYLKNSYGSGKIMPRPRYRLPAHMHAKVPRDNQRSVP